MLLYKSHFDECHSAECHFILSFFLMSLNHASQQPNTMHTLVISFKFSYKESFPPTRSVKIKRTQHILGHLSLKCLASLTPLLKCLHILKMPPFLIMLLISFSFKNAANFCINIHVLVLINQYSTGLFVSYSIRRKSC